MNRPNLITKEVGNVACQLKKDVLTVIVKEDTFKNKKEAKLENLDVKTAKELYKALSKVLLEKKKKDKGEKWEHTPE